MLTMGKVSLSAVVLFALWGQMQCVLDPKVVCNYDYWFHYRNGNGKMTTDEIDFSLCTHVIYSANGVTSDGRIDIRDNWLMVEKGDLKDFSKNKGSSKALISILNTNLDYVVRDPTSRANFVRNSVDFFTEYGFDGLVLQSPQFAYFDDLVLLLKLFHAQFGTRYVIGLAVGSQPPSTFKSSEINNFVDFIAVQTYDYHGKWEHTGSDNHMVVGYGAPLDLQMASLYAWERSGAQANKLLMSIPLFAHTWILSGSDSQPGASARAPGRPGPWSQDEGMLDYNELCSEIEANPSDWEFHYNDTLASGYVVDKRTSMWVSFESTKSAQDKSNKATSVGYGGVMAVSLEHDDYLGLCGPKFPLLNAIVKGLDRNPVVKPTPTVPPTRGPVTPDPHKICQKTGTVRDPKDCNIYHKCTEFMPGIFSDDIEHCPKGEAFDEKDNTCKDHTAVPGC